MGNGQIGKRGDRGDLIPLPIADCGLKNFLYPAGRG